MVSSSVTICVPLNRRGLSTVKKVAKVPRPTSFELFLSNPQVCFQKVDNPNESRKPPPPPSPFSASLAMSYVHLDSSRTCSLDAWQLDTHLQQELG